MARTRSAARIMNLKLGLLLLTASLIALAGWLVQTPAPIQAVQVPDKQDECVVRGLAFLAKNQHKDGHWEGDDGKHPVAMTGFVGIALLMEKDDDKKSDNIKRATSWLLDLSRNDRDGLLFSGHASEASRYMEGHGLATMFLAGVCRDERDVGRKKELMEVLTRAVKYIERSQSSQGGWYHTSKLEGHDFDAVLPTVLQVQALQAADGAGVAHSEGVLDRGLGYLAKAADDARSAKRVRLSDTAMAWACHASSIGQGKTRDKELNALWKKWGRFCHEELRANRKVPLAGKGEELIDYYHAQAIYSGQNEFEAYRDAIRNHLQGIQDKDGGWPSSNGIGVGRVYATALWCTVLQLDSYRHPARRPNIPFAIE